MKRSASRILTTHTGSLPRSPAQQEALLAERNGALLIRVPWMPAIGRR